MRELEVSISSVDTYADCPGKYQLSRVENLEKRDKDAAPTQGKVLHDYFHKRDLFRLKGNPRRISDPVECHEVALYLALRSWRDKVNSYGNFAYITHQEPLAQKFFDMLPLTKRILDRYFLARGRDDMERYRPLFVEKYLRTVIYEDDDVRIWSHGYVDLVALDLDTGVAGTWEYKSKVKKIPQEGVRFRDIQTLIYGEQVRHDHGIKVGEVIWQYILQQDPGGLVEYEEDDPRYVRLFNKDGKPSRDKGLSTNYETWSHRMRQRGFDPNAPEYEDIAARLRPRELESYFPRYTRETLVNKRFMLDNYVAYARRIDRDREAWKQGEEPLWHLQNSDCDYCAMHRICEARILQRNATRRAEAVAEAKNNFYEQRPKREDEVAKEFAESA